MEFEQQGNLPPTENRIETQNNTSNTVNIADTGSDPNTVDNGNNQSDIPDDAHWGVTIDPVTGERGIGFINRADEQEKQEPKQQEKEYVVPTINQQQSPQGLTSDVGKYNAGQQQQQAVPIPYTEQEFAIALQLGQVDSARVPEQYQEPYSKQQIQKQLGDHGNAGQSQPKELSPEEMQKAEAERMQQAREFYDNVERLAKERALQDLGITEDDLGTAEYSDDQGLRLKAGQYKTALEWHRANVINTMQQKNMHEQQMQSAQENAQKAIYNDITAYTKELKAKEPNFNMIDLYMNERYKSLPYTQAIGIANAIEALNSGTINPQQCQVLKQYYEDTRIDFYAKNNNLPTVPTKAKPAVVETPGSGAQVRPEAPDYTKLKHLDHREQDAFISKLFGLN